MNDDVEGGVNHPPHRFGTYRFGSRQCQGFQPPKGVGRTPGVKGAHRARVPSSEANNHVESFRAAYLTDDDPVRSQSQGMAHQLTQTDLPAPFGIGRPRLEPDDMAVQLELGRVLDSHYPLSTWDLSGKQVEEGGLSHSRRARDDNVLSIRHCPLQEIGS